MNYAVLELEKTIRDKRKEIARNYLLQKKINANQVCENDLLEIYALLKIKAELAQSRLLNDVEKSIKKEE